MLALAWSDVPEDYRDKRADKPVCTDHLQAYARFCAPERHAACDKGSAVTASRDSGETSHVEAWNTKWRQRQSGLVQAPRGAQRQRHDDGIEEPVDEPGGSSGLRKRHGVRHTGTRRG